MLTLLQKQQDIGKCASTLLDIAVLPSTSFKNSFSVIAGLTLCSKISDDVVFVPYRHLGVSIGKAILKLYTKSLDNYANMLSLLTLLSSMASTGSIFSFVSFPTMVFVIDHCQKLYWKKLQSFGRLEPSTGQIQSYIIRNQLFFKHELFDTIPLFNTVYSFQLLQPVIEVLCFTVSFPFRFKDILFRSFAIQIFEQIVTSGGSKHSHNIFHLLIKFFNQSLNFESQDKFDRSLLTATGSIWFCSEFCFCANSLSFVLSPKEVLPALVNALDHQDIRIYTEILSAINQAITCLGHVMTDEWWHILTILVTIEHLILQTSYNPAVNYIVQLTPLKHSSFLQQNYSDLTCRITYVVKNTKLIFSETSLSCPYHYHHLLLLIGLPIVEDYEALDQAARAFDFVFPNLSHWEIRLSGIFNSILRRSNRCVVAVSGIAKMIEFVSKLDNSDRLKICELIKLDFITKQHPAIICSLLLFNTVMSVMIVEMDNSKFQAVFSALFYQFYHFYYRYSLKSSDFFDQASHGVRFFNFLSIIQLLVLRYCWKICPSSSFFVKLLLQVLSSFKLRKDFIKETIIHFLSRIAANHNYDMILHPFDCKLCGTNILDSSYTCHCCVFKHILKASASSGDSLIFDTTSKLFAAFDTVVDHNSSSTITSFFLKSRTPPSSVVALLQKLNFKVQLIDFPCTAVISLVLSFLSTETNVKYQKTLISVLVAWFENQWFLSQVDVVGLIAKILEILKSPEKISIENMDILQSLCPLFALLPHHLYSNHSVFIRFLVLIRSIVRGVFRSLPTVQNTSISDISQEVFVPISIFMNLCKVLSICAAENPKLVVKTLGDVFTSILSLHFEPVMFGPLFLIHTIVATACRPPPAISYEHQPSMCGHFPISDIFDLKEGNQVISFLLTLTDSNVFPPRVCFYAAHVSLYFFLRFPVEIRCQMSDLYFSFLTNNYPLDIMLKDFILKYSTSDPVFPHRLFNYPPPPAQNFQKSHFLTDSSIISLVAWRGGFDFLSRRPSGTTHFRMGALGFVPTLSVQEYDNQEKLSQDKSSQPKEIEPPGIEAIEHRSAESNLHQFDFESEPYDDTVWTVDSDDDDLSISDDCFEYSDDLNISGLFTSGLNVTSLPVVLPSSKVDVMKSTSLFPTSFSSADTVYAEVKFNHLDSPSPSISGTHYDSEETTAPNITMSESSQSDQSIKAGASSDPFEDPTPSHQIVTESHQISNDDQQSSNIIAYSSAKGPMSDFSPFSPLQSTDFPQSLVTSL
ncbi:hypothetical protein GEMRC1_007144 [Eukaryota sp. GEM-RC1]